MVQIVLLILIQRWHLISKMPKASSKGWKEFSYTGTNSKIKQFLIGNAIKRKENPLAETSFFLQTPGSTPYESLSLSLSLYIYIYIYISLSLSLSKPGSIVCVCVCVWSV